MRLVLKRDWEAVDASTYQGGGSNAKIPMGTHEIERIPNPFGHPNAPWLVLKGTKIGAAEGSWRQWENGVLADDPKHPNYSKPIDWEEFEVVIIE